MTWDQLIAGAKETPPAKIKKAVRVDVYGRDGETLRLVAHYGRCLRQYSEEYRVNCTKADVSAMTRKAWFKSLD